MKFARGRVKRSAASWLGRAVLLHRRAPQQRRTHQLYELFEGRPRFLRRLVQDRLPAARRASRHVFRPVIQVKNLRTMSSGEFLQCLVNFGVGLHRADFVGENVAVEVAEERKTPPDMFDGEVVGV